MNSQQCDSQEASKYLYKALPTEILTLLMYLHSELEAPESFSMSNDGGNKQVSIFYKSGCLSVTVDYKWRG